MNQFAPCPKCSNSNAEQLKFTWWGGLIGPKILKHVKCGSCGAKYNGKTGKDNTIGIVIYTVVVAVVVFMIMMVFFAAMGFLMYSTK